MLKLGLFGGMAGIGVLYSLIFHKISMSLFNNLLVQSNILGLGFGMLNFLFAHWYFYKYTELKKILFFVKSVKQLKEPCDSGIEHTDMAERKLWYYSRIVIKNMLKKYAPELVY